MNPTWLSQTKNGFRIAVQATPNAKKSEIIDYSGDVLRIRLQAQPIDGKANEALIAFLSKKLHIPKRQLNITHGISSRKKRLEITDTTFTLSSLEEKLREP